MLGPFGELNFFSGRHGGLPGVKEFIPVGVEVQLAGQYRDKFLDRPGKHCNSRRNLGDWVRCIPVCQHCPLELVAI